MNTTNPIQAGDTDTNGAITIEVNGEMRALRGALTVRELLFELKLAPERLAVELNRSLLPRERLDRRLADGDRLEIVSFVGGG